MKKAIIAVASAAFSTGLLAQVQVYGVMDQAVRVTDGETSAVSGSFNTSRLGFRSTEDLGNGLKATIWLEGKLDGNDGTVGSQDLLFSRESSVSLSSQTLGTITMGRTDTSSSEGMDTIAGIKNVGNFTFVGLGIEYAPDRAKTVRYTSPKIGGAEFRIGQSDADGSKEKLNSASVIYRSDLFTVGAGHDRTASGHTYTAVGGSVKVATADFGAMHGRKDADKETKVTILSTKVPFGAFSLMAAHRITDVDGTNTKDSTLGAGYDLSKRTKIVSLYHDKKGTSADFFQVGLVHNF